MKKYLMTVMAAVALGGLFTGCSSDADLSGGNTAEFNILKNYEDAFITRFGQPHENQTWGFGSNTAASTRALTRATDLLKSKFTLPEFRDKDDITEPTWPGLPTTLGGESFYTTWAEVEDAKIPCADDVTSTNNEWTDVYTAYIDATHTNIRADRSKGRTYYVNGSVTYPNGLDNDGATFIVLEGCSLKLGATNYNLTVYLCKDAVLDITENLNWDGTPTIDWQGNKSTSFKIEKSGAAIYMSQGSTVKAGNLRVAEGATVINDGGTIEAVTLDVLKANFYNKGGSVDVDGKFYAQGTSNQNENVEFLLADGCSLDANEIEMDDYCTLWAEGNVTADNTITAKNQLVKFYIAQGKKMKAKDLNLINNSNLLVNDGTVEITNGIALQNSGAEIVNNADMSCGSFSQAAGAKMYNVGNMTMTGLTHLDNSNSGWVNDGQWTCGSFEVLGNDKGAGNNFNNCRLTVNGEFYLNREAFILDSDAGVVCESFKIDDTSGFYLGNKSVLKINGTLTTEIVNPEYGFFAYGSEYAVVQANGIETTTNDPQSINYYGNLLVAINPHLSAEYYTAESTVKFTKDGQNIATIPSSTCSPGYEGTTPPPSDPGDFICRVIAEDLTVGENTDFDFNDVVFDVYSNGVIRIRACGGTLPLRVDGREVHGLFGKEIGEMINTGWNGSIDYENTYRDIEYSGGPIADAAAANGILVEVQKQGQWWPLDAPVGEVASKIAVDNDYPWCSERQDIDSKWHLSNTGFKPFSEFVQGRIIGNEWYQMVIREAAKYQNKKNNP